MNWRRGLFRLWIVGTVLFVIAVAFVSYSDIKEEFEDASATHQPVTDPEVIKRFEESRLGTTLKPVTDPALIKRLERTPHPWATLGMWASIAFGIPLVVLVLGASLVWAFAGFAAKRP